MRATSVKNALRERNVRFLVASGAVTALGNGMAQVALAFAVLRIGGAADLASRSSLGRSRWSYLPPS